jgi:polyisoprenoid-binding protein YceI
MTLLALGAGVAPLGAQTSDGGASADPTRWVVVAGEGNVARYRVREQLARINFPSDAVGETTAVTGVLVVATDGSPVPGESRFLIRLDSLVSDESRRDNYLRRRTLMTETHPTATFVPTAIEGLEWPLPDSAGIVFRLRGDLTVGGTTREVAWDVNARVADGVMRGQARTSFTCAEFGLEKPSVDDIRLEYDFDLRRVAS